MVSVSRINYMLALISFSQEIKSRGTLYSGRNEFNRLCCLNRADSQKSNRSLRRAVCFFQLLTKVCQTPGGHAVVSEAVSTLRLKYGEGGRFRFLAGALLAPRAAIALRVAGVSFLNAFLKSAPRTQTRLYIQVTYTDRTSVFQRILERIENEK